MDGSQVKISFDEEYRLRVLDSAQFKQAEELEKECSSFLDSKFLMPFIRTSPSICALTVADSTGYTNFSFFYALLQKLETSMRRSRRLWTS